MSKLELTGDAIGMYVTYIPKNETGRIKKFDNDMQIAWVAYNVNDDWNDYQNYTGVFTQYSDIRFTDNKEASNES